METIDLAKARLRFMQALQNEVDRMASKLDITNKAHADMIRREANISQRHGLLDAQNIILDEMQANGSSDVARRIYGAILDRIEELRSEANKEEPTQ